MEPFSVDELLGMRITQESAMLDQVMHMVWSETRDTLNAMIPAWTDGRILSCGIDMTGGSEMRDGGRITVRWDARLRLPLGTSFDLRDRFRVLRRYGQVTDSNTVYEVLSPAEEGPSGLQVDLRKVSPSE